MSLESKMADLMRALKASGPQAPVAEPMPLQPAPDTAAEATPSASSEGVTHVVSTGDEMESIATELLSGLREEARNGRLPAPLPGALKPDPKLEALSLQELADRLDSLLP